MSILDIKIEGERYMHANDEIISLADFRKKLKRFQECYDEIYFRGEVEEFPNREPVFCVMKDIWKTKDVCIRK